MADLAPDVPVFVDALIEPPEGHDDAFARCSYFTIEPNAPDPTWTLDHGGRELPFLLRLRLAGIVTQPVGQNRFTTADEVDGLYALVEEDGRFDIALADAWVPGFLLERRWQAVMAGDVYRMGRALFTTVLGFRSGHFDWRTFVDRCRKQSNEIEFSEVETHVFRVWSKEQYEAARSRLPKDLSLRLQRRDDREGWR